MKKIAGILAAAAVLATSVFAADVSAGVKLSGSLFNYDGNSEGIGAINIKSDNNPWDMPVTFSISSDVAGGTFKFTDHKTVLEKAWKYDDKTDEWVKDEVKVSGVLASCNHQIWFKPVEMLTVKLGNIAESMNTESIDWGGRVLNYDSFGYEAVVNTNGVTVALSLVTGKDTYLISKAKGADIQVGEINLYGAYSADFGTISAMADFKNTFKEIGVAAGYKNTFDSITLFADVAFKANTKENKNGLAVDADVVFAKDALNLQAYVKGELTDLSSLASVEKSTIKVLAKAKLSYALDAGTVFLKVGYDKASEEKSLADKFDMTVKPGFEGSVGIMNYDVAVDFTIAEKIKIDVPVSFKVAF